MIQNARWEKWLALFHRFQITYRDGRTEFANDMSRLVGQAGGVAELSERDRIVDHLADYAPIWTRGVNTDIELVGLILRYS